MIPTGETELEMVQRHVREGQAHVARQREIVAGLSPDSDLAKTAHRLLALFEDVQASHCEHLARLLR